MRPAMRPPCEWLIGLRHLDSTVPQSTQSGCTAMYGLLRAIATASTEDEAFALIAPMEAEIRRAVGDAILGEDDETPESQVASLLKQRGHTLGIMETFTGGLLASKLADVAGSAGFLRGSVVAYGGRGSRKPRGAGTADQTPRRR